MYFCKGFEGKDPLECPGEVINFKTPFSRSSTDPEDDVEYLKLEVLELKQLLLALASKYKLAEDKRKVTDRRNSLLVSENHHLKQITEEAEKEKSIAEEENRATLLKLKEFLAFKEEFQKQASELKRALSHRPKQKTKATSSTELRPGSRTGQGGGDTTRPQNDEEKDRSPSPTGSHKTESLERQKSQSPSKLSNSGELEQEASFSSTFTTKTLKSKLSRVSAELQTLKNMNQWKSSELEYKNRELSAKCRELSNSQKEIIKLKNLISKLQVEHQSRNVKKCDCSNVNIIKKPKPTQLRKPSQGPAAQPSKGKQPSRLTEKRSGEEKCFKEDDEGCSQSAEVKEYWRIEDLLPGGEVILNFTTISTDAEDK